LLDMPFECDLDLEPEQLVVLGAWNQIKPHTDTFKDTTEHTVGFKG